MEIDKSYKHYLDTSILRPFLFGTKVFKKYLISQLGRERLYISKFIQMEFKRSYLLNIISFYFVIQLSTMKTVDDAFRFWSNKYQGHQLKAILQLVGEIIESREIDINNPNDKPKALRQLGRYIKRIEYKLRREFKVPGQNSTRCERAEISLKADPENMAIGFKDYLNAFDDTKSCRDKCRVDHFLLTKFSSELKTYIEYADKLKKNNETKAFKKIAGYLKKIVENGENVCSCRMCGYIGDAIIALEAPADMRLEHIDRAFDYLCKPINQPHKRHPSEISYIKNLEATNCPP